MRDPYAPYADEQAASTPTPSIGPTPAELRQRAIDNCPLCDNDGYTGRTVCDHTTGHQEAAARGMAAIRAKMGWQPTTPRRHAENRSDQRTAPGTGHQ